MRKFFLKHKILGLILVAGLSCFVWHDQVRAAGPPIPQGTIPTAGDFDQGSQVALITAIYGNGYVLDSPNSTVRLYSPNQANTINIINGGNCPGQGGDVGPDNSQTTTTFTVYKLVPDNSAGGAAYDNTPFLTRTPPVASVTSKTIKCNSVYPISFSAAASDKVIYGPTSGSYGFEIEAIMSATGGPGWNQFKYQVASGNGRLSYYAGAGDHFAVKATDGASPDPGNYSFGFAPGCKMPDDGDYHRIIRPLQWFDEDAGQSNQKGQSPVVTQITEYDASGNPTGAAVPIYSISGGSNGGFDANGRIINITSGNNVGGEVVFGIKGHHKYKWINYNIYTGNGIQFQLPYDSFNTMINFNTDCPQPYSASCTVSPGNQAGLAPNTAVSVTVTVKNNGGVDWHPSDVPQIQLERKLSTGVVTYPPITSDVSSGGGTFPFSFTERSPTSPGTKTINYRMWRSGVGYMSGSGCQIKLTTGPFVPPSSSPSIQANCSTTKVTIPKASILATWHPPPVTHKGLPPYPKITKVPVQIVITESGTGTVIGSPIVGIDIASGDGTYTTSTFGLAPGMWPHKNYDIHLIVKGTLAQDSATYNNDGNWGATYSAVDFNTEQGIGDCLHLTCGPTSSPDLEPGQSTSFSAGVNYTNETQQTYPTNPAGGYYFHINSSGGLVGAPGDVGGDNIGAGSGTANASFNARLDYRGSFSISFMFQGAPLDLGQGNPCPDQEVTPATRPYLQVWGGDINTGGGFKTQDITTGAFSCPNSYPDYVSPSTTSDVNSGGIKTFAADDGTYGSLSDFGALSLGVIAQNSSAHINFGAQPSFANTASPRGQLNSGSPDYCVINFFSQTQKTPSPTAILPPSNLSSLAGSPTDQYIVDQNVDNFGGGVVPSGRKITLYVKGDITITGNITYSGWDPNNPDSAPSFALIVKGNINIDAGVTRIDGLYIAQPSGSGQDGSFNTCANNSGNQFCVQQFVANGAVIARIIMPLRSVGTLSPDANPAFAPPPGHKPAEIFNFIPSMVITAPNFSPVYNSLQGLFSLPPVF